MRAFLSVFLGFGLLLLASCEREKTGTIDPALSSPFLASAELDHGSLNLTTDTTGSVVKIDTATYRITVRVTGTAFLRGEIPGGRLEIFKPGTTSSFVKTSFPVQRRGGDTLGFSSTVSFVISSTDVGLLRFEFLLATPSGSESNLVERSLLVTRGVNHPPAFTSVTVPDTVVLPPGDSLLIRMSAAVLDSDGVADVSEVFFYSLNSSNPSQKFQLYDDGSLNSVPPSGDLVAGDGTFTITVKLVDTPTVRKTYAFEFHALDKQGGAAPTVSKFLTVR